MTTTLRSFILRDDKQVQEYVEAIDGGAIQGIRQGETYARGAGGGIGLAAGPAQVSVRGERERQTSAEAEVVRTPAANFERLHSFLKGEGQIDSLPECTDEILETLPTGHLLDVAVIGELIPQDRKVLQIQNTTSRMNESLARAKDYQRQVEPMLQVAQEFGVDLKAANPEFDRNLKSIERLSTTTIPQGEQPTKLAVVATLVGYSRPTFIIPVRTETLQRSADELDGEYFVFAKVFRRVLSGDSVNPADFSGMLLSSNRAARRRERGNRKAAASVKGPALVLDPIAIYR